ncbi:thymidylate kinase [Nematostella vectensis]|uniref:thymidylate kinase n=1 Tax=Nematostella vectensis TaxID=45351 RepID=UPI00207767A1|nr:thymidylate kinase [Nematostella vectensis]
MTLSTRGALICFEGCDRSGKSTQSRLLVDYLRSLGTNIEHMRFPDRSTAIGQCINSYLQGTSELDDHAIHLLFSANRWESVPKIRSLLNTGTTIVVDRYAFSGAAFTSAKKGFDLEWCKAPDRGLPAPDIVIFLDISVDNAAERSEYGGERYETSDFQRSVANRYKELQADSWKVLDAGKSIEELHKEIQKIACETIKHASDKALEPLWTSKVQ